MKTTARVLAAVTVAAAIAGTAGCVPPPTHYAHCAVPGQPLPRIAEPDACDGGDDDHNPRARWFYVPNDDRHDHVSQLTPGDDIPGGLGSFDRPRGNNVDVVAVVDD